MKIIVLVFLCLGLLFYLGMVAAMIADKPKWANLFFFLVLMSEGVALMIVAVLEFLNL